MTTPADSANRLLELMRRSSLTSGEEGVEVDLEVAAIIADLDKGCFEQLTSLNTAQDQAESLMNEPPSFQAPLAPPAVAVPVYATLPESSAFAEKPLNDLSQVVIKCLKLVGERLITVSMNFDSEFERNSAAVIWVELVAGVISDAHWQQQVRLEGISILLNHVGWGRSLVGITEDRINAVRHLKTAYENPTFDRLPIWPWNVKS